MRKKFTFMFCIISIFAIAMFLVNKKYTQRINYTQIFTDIPLGASKNETERQLEMYGVKFIELPHEHSVSIIIGFDDPPRLDSFTSPEMGGRVKFIFDDNFRLIKKLLYTEEGLTVDSGTRVSGYK